MTIFLTETVAVIYLVVAIGHVAEGRFGLGLAFFAYAFANVGLVLAEKGL